jgi:3-oxoacyl-[acyl-carrier protein] reductase
MFELTGQTALVTGAGTGIGEVIAQRLAAAGARVAIADVDVISATAVAERIGAGAFALVLDVTNPAQVAAAVARVIATTGSLEILVNNAGIAGKAAPIWEQTDEDWHKVMNLNINAPFYLCRAVLPHMRNKAYGRIVNIASIAGKEGNPNASAYSASKAGVIALTKSLGKELATSEIRVNCVAPAAVRTPLFDQMTPQHLDFMLSKIPLGRFGEVDEIAALVCWLASEECSFSTGAVFDISGGRATY